MSYTEAVMNTVQIDKDEYERLKAHSRRYIKLVAAGVDNWDGYDYAFEEEDDDS